MGLNNGFIRPFMPPVEAGGTLSQHEIVRRRIDTIKNSRELLYVAIPLPKELTPSTQRYEMEVAAAQQAMKLIEKQPDNVVEFFPDKTATTNLELARKAVEDAQKPDETIPEAA